MVSTAEAFDACDGEEVGSDTLDTSSHAHEHAAELLDIRFASGIIYCCDPTRQDGSHDDIGSAGDRGLIEEHIAPL